MDATLLAHLLPLLTRCNTQPWRHNPATPSSLRNGSDAGPTSYSCLVGPESCSGKRHCSMPPGLPLGLQPALILAVWSAPLRTPLSIRYLRSSSQFGAR